MTRQSRREFLRTTGCAALSAAAFSAGLDQLGLMNAFAQIAPNAPTDYKALVCIFLHGGNDGNNTVIPTDLNGGYNDYASARGTLAISLAQLLPYQITPPRIGTTFAFHPQLAELHTLWGQQKVAVVCNTGPLVEPTTRTTFRNGTARKPYQLFSHSDQIQIWHTARPDTRRQTGWGGLIADRLLALNNGINFPMNTSIAGTQLFTQGVTTRPLAIGTGALNNVLNLFMSGQGATARRTSMDFLRTIDRQPLLVNAASESMQNALDVEAALSENPAITTTFPNTGLANQLLQVARVMKLNQTSPALGVNRQIFFCQLGGFDTHQNQPAVQINLLRELSQAMNAFYNATIELGVENRVTTFTLSDFSRTLQPSGNGASIGTDHGWGNHHFVMGGAVRGGDFYGVNGVNGSPFPTLRLGNASDCDADNRGRWIPSTSSDQYGATLGRWFGLAEADLPLVFPLVDRFSTSNLGFML